MLHQQPGHPFGRPERARDRRWLRIHQHRFNALQALSWEGGFLVSPVLSSPISSARGFRPRLPVPPAWRGPGIPANAMDGTPTCRGLGPSKIESRSSRTTIERIRRDPPCAFPATRHVYRRWLSGSLQPSMPFGTASPGALASQGIARPATREVAATLSALPRTFARGAVSTAGKGRTSPAYVARTCTVFPARESASSIARDARDAPGALPTQIGRAHV